MQTIEDVDIDVLLLLSLEELRNACQMNQYYHRLCQSDRIQNKITAVNDRINLIFNQKTNL